MLGAGSFHNRIMTSGGNAAKAARTAHADGEVRCPRTPAAHTAKTQSTAHMAVVFLDCMPGVYGSHLDCDVPECTPHADYGRAGRHKSPATRGINAHSRREPRCSQPHRHARRDSRTWVQQGSLCRSEPHARHVKAGTQQMAPVLRRNMAIPLWVITLCAATLTSPPHLPVSVTTLLAFAAIGSWMMVMFRSSLGTGRRMFAALPLARRHTQPAGRHGDRGDR
jgi:hypothetical protein